MPNRRRAPRPGANKKFEIKLKPNRIGPMKQSPAGQITNMPLKPDQSNTGRKLRRNLFPKLIFGVFGLCVGIGLLLPALNRTGNHHRRVSGQFQADLRTFIAGVRYLLYPETMPVEKTPVLTTATNRALVQRASAQTPAPPELSCDPTSPPGGALTNSPEQI
jgi:hypothetical protein